MQKVIKCKVRCPSGSNRLSLDTKELEEQLNAGWKVVAATPIMDTTVASFPTTLEVVYVLED